MKAKGWITKSIGQLFNEPLYQNSQDDSSSSPVYQQNIIVNATGTVSGLIPTGTAASSSAAVSNSLVAAASASSAAAPATTKSSSSALSRYSTNGSILSMGAPLLALISITHFLTFA